MRTLFWILASGCLPLAAMGEEATLEPIEWRCNYQPQPEPVIACRLARPLDPDAQPSQDTRWDHLPPFVRQLRRDPGALGNQPIHIPLYGPPTDARLAGRLAQGVMCGTRPAATSAPWAR